MNNFLKNKHLISRAGFGIHHNDIEKYKNISSKKLYQELKINSYEVLQPDVQSITPEQYQEMSKATDKKSLNQFNKKYNIAVRKSWHDQMINTPNQLREKMALFWHSHFATRIQHPLFNKDIIEIFRKNALGNFRDLVFEVSKSSAMLNFLNNQQNKKARPNENFARELMELFTLGRGNLYTEKDIKESARAFTGWSYNGLGEFTDNKKQHDTGEKEFLGKSGNFDGTDIINIILEKPECADFITRKIYQFFVNETPDEKIVKSLSQKFYKSNYDIMTLMDEIFLSDWFYSEKNIGAKIKSPVELIVGIRRIMPMDLQNKDTIYNFEKLLGQELLQPPNVAGWPSGMAWIDSSTLLLRMKIPSVMANYKTLDIEPKSNDDVNMGKEEKKVVVNKKQNTITIHWDSINNILDQDLFEILLANPNEKIQSMITQFNADKSKKHLMITIMSTPEYQLC
ncbi:DUF1800 domain-containing protein [Epilithonimonas hungarica]|uniref:Uncharacterized conserved protein, DUF1800 family n=1 Tax=Epilithonimonas hungarica TaxID=454006 RepID=A0A1G7HYV4_9FLAO|nr:DUF1800 domain-containing protein [Epilithonimonas hungarica]SDF05314.1 Uncharacterized conserved protein, DUF1800 family [Epilithonimonas hungarica]